MHVKKAAKGRLQGYVWVIQVPVSVREGQAGLGR